MSGANVKAPVTKAPPAPPADAGQAEAPVRERRKLSLHYGASAPGGRP
jgi:hypothetical protein